MTRVPTSAVAALSLVLGFAVADLSGVRALGGLVLVVALAWCARVWWRSVGAGVAAGLALAYLGAFALSHVLAVAVGAWLSVLLVASAVGVLVLAVADRPKERTSA